MIPLIRRAFRRVTSWLDRRRRRIDEGGGR